MPEATFPIFVSVSHALHVAYLMAVQPGLQRSPTQVLIESLQQQHGKVEQRVASMVNRGDLRPIEFRAQCALVVAAARGHLMPPEHAAVRARFGHQRTKAEGVAALAEYVQPSAGIEHALALRALVWRQYHVGGQRDRDRWSLRAIEKETGVTVHVLRRAADVVRSMGEALEVRADARLALLFEQRGLIPPAAEVAQAA